MGWGQTSVWGDVLAAQVGQAKGIEREIVAREVGLELATVAAYVRAVGVEFLDTRVGADQEDKVRGGASRGNKGHTYGAVTNLPLVGFFFFGGLCRLFAVCSFHFGRHGLNISISPDPPHL